MAIIALHSAATGLSALNTSLDVISNNLANLNTPGFKSSRANFQDLLYVERAQPGVQNGSGDQSPTGLYIGLGTRVTGTQNTFVQGPTISTDRPMDIAIDGLGFFRVKVEDRIGDGFAYTRSGNFTLNSDGELVLAGAKGRRLDPTIRVPDDAIPPISISANGEVFVSQPGQTEPQKIGDIQLAVFINPEGLKPIGENLFADTTASGPPILGVPATDQRGQLIQNHLEGSNVDPTRELIELIKTQRAFEMNSNTIRAADSTLQQVSNLRRS